MHYLAGAFHSACRPFQALVTGAPAAAEAPPAVVPTPNVAEAPPSAAPTSATVTDVETTQQPPELPERGPVTTSESLDDEVLLSRYELDTVIGRGGYSVVWRGTERASSTGTGTGGDGGGGGGAVRHVAIKRIVDAFRNEDDARRTYREVALQRECRCEHILQIHAVLRATNGRDAYLVSLRYIAITPPR